MSELPRTTSRLEADVAEGLFTAGAQVVVARGDEVLLDVALGQDGLGRPTSPETRFRVYCTGKPLTALAVAGLVDRGDLDLDEPLEDRLPRYRCLAGGVALRHVLDHTAGLHVPDGRTVELTAPERRQALLEGQERPPGWQVGRQAAYSEHLAWWILGDLVAAVTGDPVADHLQASVLDPFGLEHTTIGMAPDQHRAVLPTLGVNLDLRSLRPFPMLFERTERVCTEVNPGHGTITTARDLARFYRGVLALRRGDPPGGAPTTSAAVVHAFTSDARPALDDLVLRRSCRFGLGFMTTLADHAFGSGPSADAFGHSGNVGSSFAFADPALDLVVAVVFNGIVDPDTAFWRRRALVDAIFADLHDLDGGDPTADPGPDAADAPTSRWRRRRRG